MRVALFRAFFVCCSFSCYCHFCLQLLQVTGSMPPLPEKYREAPDNEEVESESELPPAQLPTTDAPEASEGQTRKRSRSKLSDASTSPTLRGPSFLERHGEDDGAYSAPYPTVPL